MGKWFVGNLTLVNLTLVISSILSYTFIMHRIALGTEWGGYKGEIGGVLEYHAFDRIEVYHVTRENLRGELVFSFLDITSYLLAALTVVNGIGALVPNLRKHEPGGVHVQRLAFTNLILAALSLIVYANGTLGFIDGALKRWSPAGGVVNYAFLFVIHVTHVVDGHIESSLNTLCFDKTSWVLLIMLVSTLIVLKLQLISVSQRRPEKTITDSERTDD